MYILNYNKEKIIKKAIKSFILRLKDLMPAFMLIVSWDIKFSLLSGKVV